MGEDILEAEIGTFLGRLALDKVGETLSREEIEALAKVNA